MVSRSQPPVSIFFLVLNMEDFVPVDRDEHGCLLATAPAKKEDFGFFDCRWQFEDLFRLNFVRQRIR